MVKRGRQQLAGLRFHRGKGQWYRIYNGKERYFGPRNISKTDNDAKKQAEKEWHLYEVDTDIPAFVPSISFEQAKAELELLPLNEGTITDEVIKQWRLLNMKMDRQSQRQFLIDLGVPTDFFNASPDIWDKISSGSIINPHLSPEQYIQVISRFSNIQIPNGTYGPTVKEVIDYYCSFCKKHRSQSQYSDASNRLPHFVKFVGSDTRLSQLTQEHFVQYRDFIWQQIDQRKQWEMKQKDLPSSKDKRKAPGWSAAHANKHLRLVKAAFSRYHKDKGLQTFGLMDCLATLETRGSGQIVDIPIITPSELKLILDNCSDFWATITLLGLNMAASNEDINSIKWRHFKNMKGEPFRWGKDTKGYIDYPRGKNNNPRRIVLWSSTIKKLKSWKAQSNSADHLFLNAHRGRLITFRENSKTRKLNKTDNLSINFAKKMKALDLPHSFRAIRKSTATITKIYADDGTVSMILGNAGHKIWRKYTMAIPDVVAEAITKVGKHYGQG